MMDKKSQHRSKSKRVRERVSAIVLVAFAVMLFTFTASLVSAGTVTYDYDDAGRLVKVDYGDGKIIEYNYDNAGNLLTREISVMPDLVITEKWVCWPDNCTICYNVTNIGNGTAPAGHTTTLYVDCNETAHDQVPVDLAPNESYTGCFNASSWIYTLPDDNITVCADNNKTIAESDEGNNCLTNRWKCGDVDGNGYINMADVGLLWPHKYYPAVYPINEWTGDVDGNGYINMADVGLLWPHKYYPDEYPLNCRCS